MEDAAASIPWRSSELELRWRVGYRVALPTSPAPSAGHPLLLALHGFGEDAARFSARLAPLVGGPYALLVPDAPFPVEIREEEGARIGRAWYQYDGDAATFERALRWGAAHLEQLLREASRAFPLDPCRVVLLGYSQGGYLGSVTALRDRARYLGLVAISTRVKSEILAEELRSARGYPVLALHGERDRSTPLEPQRRSLEALRASGLAVELEVHAGGHGFRSELLPRIDSFVRGVLALPPRT
ncbi:MAG: dienelactone hydrolase family protein [Planctomycetes bacterium]|nr:dienelactone hydrolase family protein [Planctomycetota bacterium]